MEMPLNGGFLALVKLKCDIYSLLWIVRPRQQKAYGVHAAVCVGAVDFACSDDDCMHHRAV